MMINNNDSAVYSEFKNNKYPYHSGQAFYRLALRPPAGPMHITTNIINISLIYILLLRM